MQTLEQANTAVAVAQTASGKLGTLWCDLVHDSPMWPIHGQYQCRTCGRRYPVLWAADRLEITGSR